MRQHAEEIFVEKGVRVKFDAPEDGSRIKLSLDVRRELYLIFKEAINNAARHSDCTRIEIVFRADGKKIFLKIADNGRGFETTKDSGGNGLANMKNRVQKIGGKFHLQSAPECGTIIEIYASQN